MENKIGTYNNLDPAIEARVETLLAQMTLPEKVGQLVQISPYAPFDQEDYLAKKQAAEEAGEPFDYPVKLRQDMDDLLRAGRVGSFLNIMIPHLINHCQRVAVKESRLGIPLIVGGDVIHGFRTIFPIPLAESSTWNPDLLERASRVAAEEASAVGVDWIFAPMIDVARDP